MTKINKERIATYKQICKKYKDEIRYEELIPRRYEIFQSYNIRLRNLGWNCEVLFTTRQVVLNVQSDISMPILQLCILKVYTKLLKVLR